MITSAVGNKNGLFKQKFILLKRYQQTFRSETLEKLRIETLKEKIGVVKNLQFLKRTWQRKLTNSRRQ